MRVEIKGQPATMKGVATLLPNGTGTAFEVDGDVKVAIPFIGKKIEPEVHKAVVASLRHEVQLGLHQALAAHPGSALPRCGRRRTTVLRIVVLLRPHLGGARTG